MADSVDEVVVEEVIRKTEVVDDIDSVAISLNPDAEPEEDEQDAKGLSWTSSLVVEEKPRVVTGEAEMPVDKDAAEYNMTHKHRGKAVIFNQKHFKIDRLNTRNGTDADRENLATALKNLDFDVEIYDDLDYTKLMQKLDDLSADDHTDRDCLLIAVFSHGIPNKIYTCDSKYNQNELWDPFTAERCPSLAGKPKIFLIQACQGDQLDGGTILQKKVQLMSSAGFSETDSAPVRERYTIPNRADFVMVFSTVPGYYSWRNQSRGSWFIQAVCQELRKNGKHKALQAMLTTISRNVALNFESYVPYSEMDQKKQIPYVTSTLIREVYFNPKSPTGECLGRIVDGQALSIEPPISHTGSKKGGITLLSSLVRPTSKPMKTNTDSGDSAEADLDMDSLTEVNEKSKISSPSTRRQTLVKPFDASKSKP